MPYSETHQLDQFIERIDAIFNSLPSNFKCAALTDLKHQCPIPTQNEFFLLQTTKISQQLNMIICTYERNHKKWLGSGRHLWCACEVSFKYYKSVCFIIFCRHSERVPLCTQVFRVSLLFEFVIFWIVFTNMENAWLNM